MTKIKSTRAREKDETKPVDIELDLSAFDDDDDTLPLPTNDDEEYEYFTVDYRQVNQSPFKMPVLVSRRNQSKNVIEWLDRTESQA